MEKKTKFLGNYYGGVAWHTGSVCSRKGIKPTICAIDWKDGKGLVLRIWKRRSN